MADRQFIERFLRLMKAHDDIISELQALSERQLEVIGEMQGLGQDFHDHVNRMRVMHDGFQKLPKMPRAEELETSADIVKLNVGEEFQIPNAVKPPRRGDGQ